MRPIRTVIALLAWLVALGGLGLSLLAHGGRWSPWLDIFTHMAPAYVAAALMALALSPLAPRGGRAALAMAALLGVGVSAALVAPEHLAPQPPSVTAPGPAGAIKLIAFNTWSRNAEAEAVTEWLLAQKPDVIVLVEPGAVRDRLRADGYIAVCPSCGVTIFSRSPPLRSFPKVRPGRRTSFVVGATYADARGEFTVVGVHRAWPTRVARGRAQAAELHAAVAGLPKARLILAGDFNSTPWSFARRGEDETLGLSRRTRALFTWPAAQVSDNRLPAPFPYLPIDHVYAGPGWATVKVERGPELGSDHYPVIVTLAPVGSVGR